jgi:alkylhydroperoxidase family enzyme
LSEEQIAHVGDDPVPPGVYDDQQAAVVRYAQRTTRMDPIGDDLYRELKRFFTDAALIELCFIVGSANLVNRFHATFRTDVERATLSALATSCPLPLPPLPGQPPLPPA